MLCFSILVASDYYRGGNYRGGDFNRGGYYGNRREWGGGRGGRRY